MQNFILFCVIFLLFCSYLNTNNPIKLLNSTKIDTICTINWTIVMETFETAKVPSIFIIFFNALKCL